MKLIHTKELLALIGISRTTLWRWEREGAFPPRLRLGPNVVAWSHDEVSAWLAERPRPTATGAATRLP